MILRFIFSFFFACLFCSASSFWKGGLELSANQDNCYSEQKDGVQNKEESDLNYAIKSDEDYYSAINKKLMSISGLLGIDSIDD